MLIHWPTNVPRLLIFSLAILMGRPLFAWQPALAAVNLPAAAVLSPAADVAPLPNITQLATGDDHVCALIAGGGLICWGDNSYGQLGDGTLTAHALPGAAVGLARGVQAVAASGGQTCALTTAGVVKCWGGSGSNDDGQQRASRSTRLQDTQQTITQTLPVEVAGLGGVAISITVGSAHACALTSAGGVKCWGADNSYGQLGDGANVTHTTPSNVVGLTSNVRAIAAGSYHTCALLNSGGVKCWGDNYDGQLGDGTTTVTRTTPVNVVGLASDVRAIAAGSYHTCALLNSGAVKCWGYNYDGQLGDGTATQRITPINVVGLSSGVTALTLGAYHTCAVQAGNAKCWGNNASGQLGNATTTGSTTPIDVIGLGENARTMVAGNGHTCALLLSGRVKCWGNNSTGQLGNGASGNQMQPTDVTGLTSGMRAVTAGGDNTCALTVGGGIKCWGANFYGELGDGTTIRRPTPVDTIGLSGEINTVALHDNHTCAVTTGGGAKCWGSNGSGQLGDNTTTSHLTPNDVTGLTSGVSDITVGGSHTCALTTVGGVKCWGANFYGQLGDNTTTGHLVPADVAGLTSGVSAIEAGSSHTCAVTSGGGVKCWGYNGNGQLGDNTTTTRLAPSDVAGLTSGVRMIAVGIYHTCAVLNSGGVKCWGDNYYGQLGDNTTTSRLTPVDVIGLTSGIRDIAVGAYHTCVVLDSGGVKCWGANYYGQLGDNTTTSHLVPVDVTGLTADVSNLEAGSNHTCAVTNGGVKCWGANYYGQLGNGGAWRTTPGDVLTTCLPLSRFHSGAGSDPVATPANSSGCPVDQFWAGETIQLTSTPATGWIVNSWNGANNDASNSLSNTVTMPPTPHSITVIYTKLPDTPPPTGNDAYEPDDTCAQAQTLMANGQAQEHTFHQIGDTDWLQVAIVAGAQYQVEVQTPPTSPADVNLELFPTCESASAQRFAATFTPSVRLNFTATTTGSVFLRLTNADANVAGPTVTYQPSIRKLDSSTQKGALILVAGRLKNVDAVQKNIHHVTEAVYKLYLNNGYGADDINYLATDPSLLGYDQAATTANLQTAIVTWAASKVGSNRSLTLYLMDHGDKDKFFLDDVNQQVVTPGQLDGWLDQLEAAVPGVKITIIIEACYSGSFIEGVQSISQPGRLIMASTNQQSVAYASATGAYFSDQFLAALQQNYSLHNSFRAAYAVARELTGLIQEPWLDGNGNGIPNEPEDVTLASQRSAGYTDKSTETWAPYVVSVTGPATFSNRRGVIQAEVRDNKHVRRVWAVIYAPSYRPPVNSAELVPETLPTIVLQGQGNDKFAGEYPGFDESGLYRVAVYAEDDEGLIAQPKIIQINTGYKIFLPSIMR
ncbi:MAG: hypothetical protein NT075_21285 [Chloroflexi bacterium]|nr:hypothetical protein [Chloroflexota bacterium]